MRRLIAPLSLLMLGGIAIAGALGIAPSDAASTDVRVQVARMVSGIVGYARWPIQAEAYSFCSAGEAVHLRNPQESLAHVVDRPISAHLLAQHDGASDLAACDILYFGSMPSTQRSRLLALTAGRPILTITEDDALCEDATMFCLAIRGSDVRLLANLDAIARSGIRIDPKVLQLLQRRLVQP